jgi:hypothetical protein
MYGTVNEDDVIKLLPLINAASSNDVDALLVFEPMRIHPSVPEAFLQVLISEFVVTLE